MIAQEREHLTLTTLDLKVTKTTGARYARLAAFYGLLEILPELPWRHYFWRELMNRLPAHGGLIEVNNLGMPGIFKMIVAQVSTK